MSTIGVVAGGAGGVETLRVGLVQPLLDDGHTVAVTLTPTAASWLAANDELDALQRATGLPVRFQPRLPGGKSLHPRIDLFIAAPMTANSVAKLALGLADNQALTVLCENIATTPMVVFPRINAAHARQPAWTRHLRDLRAAGVDLIYGDDVWPLAEPRQAGPRELPWTAVLTAAKQHC